MATLRRKGIERSMRIDTFRVRRGSEVWSVTSYTSALVNESTSVLSKCLGPVFCLCCLSCLGWDLDLSFLVRPPSWVRFSLARFSVPLAMQEKLDRLSTTGGEVGRGTGRQVAVTPIAQKQKQRTEAPCDGIEWEYGRTCLACCSFVTFCFVRGLSEPGGIHWYLFIFVLGVLRQCNA